ncbi:MAG: pantetheine-phosphate adenylyltransferase [Flavobacteriales bacterium]|jgi:pantetheine-phosphate adenylyltransferase
MKKRIAVFPGSFDPITKGHENIVLRAAHLFDEIVVAIGQNSTKKYMFDLEKRESFINQAFADIDNVSCATYSGLTVDFCNSIDAQFMLRGIRSTGDFEYERMIAQMSRELDNSIETVLLFTDPSFSAIHSTVVREIIKNGGDVSKFIPKKIHIDA